ncbi:hypothetical protein ARMSODRAFT_960302, partial [Armillaria solidipes]
MPTFSIGPSSLGLSVTSERVLSTLTLQVMALYANAIADARDNTDQAELGRSLKFKLADLIESEGGEWQSNVIDLRHEEDPVARALAIITEHKCSVPAERTAWSTQILALASIMSNEQLRQLKALCPVGVWSALVFANIRPTPARTLTDVAVGKVKILEWDLFPRDMDPPCGNCTRKNHPCQIQYGGISKCRECALFQLSCPKAGPRGRPPAALFKTHSRNSEDGEDGAPRTKEKKGIASTEEAYIPSDRVNVAHDNKRRKLDHRCYDSVASDELTKLKEDMLLMQRNVDNLTGLIRETRTEVGTALQLCAVKLLN